METDRDSFAPRHVVRNPRLVECYARTSCTFSPAKIDYPNDLWDVAFTYKRIGKDFDPSLGFVPRRGINTYSFRTQYQPRPDISWLRQTEYSVFASAVTDLSNR